MHARRPELHSVSEPQDRQTPSSPGALGSYGFAPSPS
jgi:hypothetical protein